jgi:hypothetical protein
MRGSNFYKHGMFGTRIYFTWGRMIQRCLSPNYHSYYLWGGRGIKVCDEWRDFRNFYRDMGDIPDGYSLDRIDNNGNYCKANCRWATPREQRINNRHVIMVSVNGDSRCLKDWAKFLGMHYKNLHERYTRNGQKEIDKLKEKIMEAFLELQS